MNIVSRSKILRISIVLLFGVNASVSAWEKNAADMKPDEAIEFIKTHAKTADVALSSKAKVKDIFEEIPELKKNYTRLHEKCQEAIDKARIDMPVIEPEDIDEFKEKLADGYIDANEPYASHRYYLKDPFPTDLLTRKESQIHRELWLVLGRFDKDYEDDKIPAEIEYVAAEDLIPTQSQIWLDLVLNNMYKFGIASEENNYILSSAIIIISKEGYILDGHHRFGQVILANPKLKMKCLRVDLPIEKLLKVSRTYGNAIGNEQKQ